MELRARSLIFILIFIGLMVYANSLFNNFVWEDWEQLVNNPLAQNIFNILRFFLSGTYFDSESGKLVGSFYRPILMTYWSVLASIFGMNAFVFHLSQVLIHITNSILVFLLFRKFIEKNIAFWLSLIFLVHPINAEAVAYISAANDPLYFLFGMIGLLLLSKHILLSGLFLLLSLFSKEGGLVFFCIYILYSFLFHRASFKAVLLTNFGMLCAYFFVRFVIAQIPFTSGGFFPMSMLPLSSRLINIPSVIWSYLETFLFPVKLAISRESFISQISFSGFLLPLIILFAVIGGFFYSYRKVIKTKKEKLVLIFFGLWLVIGIAPYLQISGLSATFAERWFYLAEIGLLGLSALFFKGIFSYRFLPYLVVVVVLLLSGRTVLRNFDWKDDSTFFRREIETNPDSHIIQSQMGMVFVQEGNDDQAEHHFLRATELFPYDSISKINLGALYERKKDFPKAIDYFKQSMANYPTQLSYERVSTLQIVLGDWGAAEETIAKGSELYPKSSQLHFNRGLIYKNKGDKTRAVSEIRTAYELSGNEMFIEVIKKIEAGQDFKIDY